jgi:hypothetical protein
VGAQVDVEHGHGKKAGRQKPGAGNTGFFQQAAGPRPGIELAESVYDHAHFHSTAGGCTQGADHPAAGSIRVKNIGAQKSRCSAFSMAWIMAG